MPTNLEKAMDDFGSMKAQVMERVLVEAGDDRPAFVIGVNMESGSVWLDYPGTMDESDGVTRAAKKFTVRAEDIPELWNVLGWFLQEAK